MTRIKTGDRVRVLTGKDRGKEGDVMRILPSEGKLIVDGVNVVKRHTKPSNKPTRRTMQGGIIDKDMPISISSVAVLCGRCGPTRIGVEIAENGEKIRICRKCGTKL